VAKNKERKKKLARFLQKDSRLFQKRCTLVCQSRLLAHRVIASIKDAIGNYARNYAPCRRDNVFINPIIDAPRSSSRPALSINSNDFLRTTRRRFHVLPCSRLESTPSGLARKLRFRGDYWRHWRWLRSRGRVRHTANGVLTIYITEPRVAGVMSRRPIRCRGTFRVSHVGSLN